MNGSTEFEIAFVGLKPGKHQYVFEVNDKFFADYDKQDFTKCKAILKLELEKNAGLLMFHFEVGGLVEITCDRCGNSLPMELWEDFNVVVKLVVNPEEMNATEEDPDLFYISLTESHINISAWIYEFINLSIPMQRMCAEEEKGGPHCNKEVLKKLKEMEFLPKEGDAAIIWKGLDKFKNLPNN